MKIAILGAAYTGFAAAKHFKKLGHSITVTTTKESRVEELQAVSDEVMVMVGSDREKMAALLEDQDILILTVAGGMVERDGKLSWMLIFIETPTLEQRKVLSRQ